MPDAPASSFALPALKPYPVVLPKERKGLDKHAHALLARLSLPFARRHLLALQHAVRVAGKLEPEFSGLDDAALDRAARDVSMRLRRQGVEKMPLRAEALALIREVTQRTLGNRAYDVQLLGAATLMAGHIAEMATGEGKTMTAAMAAALTALAGRPVHVVTVNDYLAERDAETRPALVQPARLHTRDRRFRPATGREAGRLCVRYRLLHQQRTHLRRAA